MCAEQNLQTKDTFVKSVVQLYETIMVRHGLMVVGSTFAGKTKVIHTLAKALSMLNETQPEDAPIKFKNTKVHTMNPKAQKQGQLYGLFDENTHEWEDGVLAIIYRNCSKDPTPDRNW